MRNLVFDYQFILIFFLPWEFNRKCWWCCRQGFEPTLDRDGREDCKDYSFITGSINRLDIIIFFVSRLDIIDPALLRPGHLDSLFIYHCQMRPPPLNLQTCSRKSSVSWDVDLSALAQYTHGFSGADIIENFSQLSTALILYGLYLKVSIS